MSEDDTPVLDTLAEITASSIKRCNLEAREYMLVRLAAQVGVGAPATSYLLSAGVAADVGVTVEDVQDVLVAVAPVTGTSLVVRAAENIAKALGFAIAVAEADLDPEADGIGS